MGATKKMIEQTTPQTFEGLQFENARLKQQIQDYEKAKAWRNKHIVDALTGLWGLQAKHELKEKRTGVEDPETANELRNIATILNSL